MGAKRFFARVAEPEHTWHGALILLRQENVLPRSEASVLLLIAGLWWGVAVVAWIARERWFVSVAKEKAKERAHEDDGRTWVSTRVDVIQFGLPSTLSIGLALDGLVFGGIVLYAPGCVRGG